MYKYVIDPDKSVSFVLKDIDIGGQIQYLMCTGPLEKEVNSLTLTNINFGKELQLSKEQCLKQQINNSEEKYHDCQEHMDILKTNDVANCNQDTIQNSDSSIISHSKVLTTGVLW